MDILHAETAPRSLTECDEPMLEVVRRRVKPTFGLEHVGIREYLLVKVHKLIARSDDSLSANVSMTSFMW